MENLNTKVITGKVRFSYANVWEAKSINGSNPKYSISLLIPKSNKQTLDNHSSDKPGMLDKYKNPITNPEDFYSGCYGYASINFYAFNTNGNKGIACGLNNLMKIEDGEPLGGRVSAEIDFEGIDAATLNAEMDEIFG